MIADADHVAGAARHAAARSWSPARAGWWRPWACGTLIVVDTPDALLVCDRKQAQDIKSIVDELKQRGDRTYLTAEGPRREAGQARGNDHAAVGRARGQRRRQLVGGEPTQLAATRR